MIKSSIRAVAVLTALTAATSVFAQGIRQQRVSFKAGSTSATLPGALKGDETVDYVLGARAGQTMRVTLKTSNTSTYFNVLPPGSDAAIAIGAILGNEWSGTLPVDGDYRIRVFLWRNAARRNEATTYTLTVSITRGGDANVAGTPFHATGTVPCSVGTDAKGSATCSFGVIRKGRGQADVHLQSPGKDVAIHKDGVRILRFVGNTVTSADSTEKATARLQGDTWSISVNDFLYYEIPAAVISGG